MTSSFAQYVVTGLTIGAIYALIALGASIVFNASRAINFAQGEFVMIGALAAVALSESGMPLWLSVPGGIVTGTASGVVVAVFARRMTGAGSVEAMIIMTIGAAVLLRGLAQMIWGSHSHQLPPFSGEAPIRIAGVVLQPQGLWVLGAAAVSLALLVGFFRKTLRGKGFIATSHNRLAARLIGVDVDKVLMGSFVLAAALGAVAGVVIAPITLAYSDLGLNLGLKGFSAAILGGLGSGPGAVLGGLLLGLVEAIGAGYVSSAYKDALAYLVIIVVLLLLPGGLAGRAAEERV